MPKKNEFESKNYYWKADIDYRQNPESYRVGKGEQGVLLCEPYKSEILPLWRFKTPEMAQESSDMIYQMFENYLKHNDFVGADLARKFLQMGFTRARRYTNYRGGKKYHPETGEPLAKGTGDPQKAISAKIFYEKWQLAENNLFYKQLKRSWKQHYG